MKKSNILLAQFLLSLTLAAPSTGYAKALICREIFVPTVDKVVVEPTVYKRTVQKLRDTLTGKLATVWRSEWKAKLAVLESNRYVLELINHFLTPQSRTLVLEGLDLSHEGFTRKVHERMYELQAANRMHPDDHIMVRDKPAPAGARDTTFTYYSMPLQSARAEGKHQVRVRTYLRQITFADIPVGQTVEGFQSSGVAVYVTRVSKDSYKIASGKDPAALEVQAYSTAQLRQEFGASMTVHAPHGKNYKLEIKSVLEDDISGLKFKNLAGKHMVQKLDVSLTPAQQAFLFAPLAGQTAAGKQAESSARIDRIVKAAIEKDPTSKDRVEGVFGVVREGVARHPEFLLLVGATTYHRTAFESKGSLQTTVDRDQGMYVENMYTSQGIKNPMQVVRENFAYKPTANDARHVELKVPVTSMAQAVGIAFQDPNAAPAAVETKYDAEIGEMISIYHRYVKNNLHPGKFNFIRKTGEEDARD